MARVRADRPGVCLKGNRQSGFWPGLGDICSAQACNEKKRRRLIHPIEEVASCLKFPARAHAARPELHTPKLDAVRGAQVSALCDRQMGRPAPSKTIAKALDAGKGIRQLDIRTGRLMATQGKQLLHFVFGGELTDLSGTEFRDLSKIDIVGLYPNYASALQAWKAKSQASVDNAHMRYFIAHLHRLLDPAKDGA